MTAVLVAGCAGDTEAGSGQSDGVNEDEIERFAFALPFAPSSLDYAKSFNVASTGSIMAVVTEPLEIIGKDGGLLPNLAVSVEEPDSTTLVYRLRDDAVFSDGSPMTAEDVAWSITHAIDEEAQTASLVQGVVESATASGDLEVTVNLTRSSPIVRAALATVALVQSAVFAEENASALGSAAAVPLGTGPYAVTSFGESAVELVRNEHYWGEAPKIEELRFETITNAQTAQLAMRAGEVNGAFVLDPSTTDQWAAITGVEIYSEAGAQVDLMAIDVQTPPFDDIHVRRAIAHSVDAEGFINAAHGGQATELRGMQPADVLAGVAGSMDVAQEFLNGLPQYEFDVEAARKELEQSAHADGFDTTIYYDNDARRIAALSLQANLEKIGVNVEVVQISAEEYRTRVYNEGLTGINVYPFGGGGILPDPAFYMGLLVGTENIGPNKFNTARWGTPEVDAALSTLNESLIAEERWDATQTILKAAADDASYVPLAQRNTVYVLGEGFRTASGGLSLADVKSGVWVHDIRATD